LCKTVTSVVPSSRIRLAGRRFFDLNMRTRNHALLTFAKFAVLRRPVASGGSRRELSRPSERRPPFDKPLAAQPGRDAIAGYDLVRCDLPCYQLPPNFVDTVKSREDNVSRPVHFPAPIVRFTTIINLNRLI
jgi:hypothetical protein